MLGYLYLFKKRKYKNWMDEVQEEGHNVAEDLASECNKIIAWSNCNGSNRTCILHHWWKIERCHVELKEDDHSNQSTQTHNRR